MRPVERMSIRARTGCVPAKVVYDGFMSVIDVVAGVVSKDERILIARRRSDDSLPGKWEFREADLKPAKRMKNV